MFLTRGLVWCFSEQVYVAVTNRRLILLPDPNRESLDAKFVKTLDAGFDQVRLVDGSFQTTILEIQMPAWDEVLRLCLKPGYAFMGSNKYDFIAALKTGQSALIASQP